MNIPQHRWRRKGDSVGGRADEREQEARREKGESEWNKSARASRECLRKSFGRFEFVVISLSECRQWVKRKGIRANKIFLARRTRTYSDFVQWYFTSKYRTKERNAYWCAFDFFDEKFEK